MLLLSTSALEGGRREEGLIRRHWCSRELDAANNHSDAFGSKNRIWTLEMLLTAVLLKAK
jgi:hypothetical protein